MSKTPHAKREEKTFPIFVTKVDAAQGIVEAIVSVFGVIDYGADVIWPGAFAKTIVERFGQIKVVDQHNTDSIFRVLGKPLAMKEISRDELPDEVLQKFPAASGGLWTQTQYGLDTPEGLGAFNRIKAGSITEYSIGYEAVDADRSNVEVNGKKVNVRNIRQIRLWEFSPVIWGMNPATVTVGAKSALPKRKLPLAPRDHAWDAGEAQARVKTWATDGETVDMTKYAQAFFWVDGENEDKLTAYKLPYADVIDGKLTAVPKGIFAVAGVLNGARGGTDIPEADQEQVKSSVTAWYKAMAKEFDDSSLKAPWENKEMTADGPIARFGDYLHGELLRTAHYCLDDRYAYGFLSKEEYDLLMSLIDTQLEAMRTAMPDDLAERPLWGPYGGIIYDSVTSEGKAGRVISKTNAAKLKDAHVKIDGAYKCLTDVMKSAGMVNEDGTYPTDDEDKTAPETGETPAGPSTTPTGNDARVRALKLRAQILDGELKL